MRCMIKRLTNIHLKLGVIETSEVNWLKMNKEKTMKPFFSNVIQYRGSHYDFGFSQGKQIRDSLIVSNRERQWRLRRPKFLIDVNEAKKAYETYAPGLWD